MGSSNKKKPKTSTARTTVTKSTGNFRRSARHCSAPTLTYCPSSTRKKSSAAGTRKDDPTKNKSVQNLRRSDRIRTEPHVNSQKLGSFLESSFGGDFVEAQIAEDQTAEMEPTMSLRRSDRIRTLPILTDNFRSHTKNLNNPKKRGNVQKESHTDRNAHRTTTAEESDGEVADRNAVQQNISWSSLTLRSQKNSTNAVNEPRIPISDEESMDVDEEEICIIGEVPPKPIDITGLPGYECLKFLEQTFQRKMRFKAFKLEDQHVKCLAEQCNVVPSMIETWFAERSEQEAHLQKGMLESEKFYMQQTSTVKTVFMNALYNDDLSVDGKVNMILDKTGTENHFLFLKFFSSLPWQQQSLIKAMIRQTRETLDIELQIMLKDSINPKSHAKTFAALLKKERETRTKHAKVFMEAKINELDMGNFYETYDSFDYNPIFVIMTTQGSVPQKVINGILDNAKKRFEAKQLLQQTQQKTCKQPQSVSKEQMFESPEYSSSASSSAESRHNTPTEEQSSTESQRNLNYADSRTPETSVTPNSCDVPLKGRLHELHTYRRKRLCDLLILEGAAKKNGTLNLSTAADSATSHDRSLDRTRELVVPPCRRRLDQLKPLRLHRANMELYDQDSGECFPSDGDTPAHSSSDKLTPRPPRIYRYPASSTVYLPDGATCDWKQWNVKDVINWTNNFLFTEEHKSEILHSRMTGDDILEVTSKNVAKKVYMDYYLWKLLRLQMNAVVNEFNGLSQEY
eukprot:NP_510353.2 Uncharacterized protein CELE_F28H6.6 [Caenorhabditis elegans]